MLEHLRPLEKWTPFAALVLSTALVAAIAWLDSYLGPWIHTGILYVGPVALCAWYSGRFFAVVLAIASVFTWMAVDSVWAGHGYGPYVHLWNSFVRLFLLLLTALLVSTIHSQLQQLQNFAEQDPLTGLRNRRSFIRCLSYEHTRLARFRHPLSLVYFDLDNFKSVNDTRGHAEGDLLLRKVSEVLTRKVRSTDIPARLGGDEFSALLIESDEKAAISAIQNISHELRMAMQEEDWPVTFSIGVVTFCSPAESIDDMLICADRLMYQVKHHHKNGILHQKWNQGCLSPPEVILDDVDQTPAKSLRT